MRKFLVIFFIILALGGAGFFFGWAQMGVPADSYGAVLSKSHGVEPRLIVPGEFVWLWYKLIPANARTAVLRPSSVSRAFTAEDALPSGDVYAAFAGIENDFSWEIGASFSFRLDRSALIPLVKSENIVSQEDLERYESELAYQIEEFILRRMQYSEEFAQEAELMLANGDTGQLEREISRAFPPAGNFSLRIQAAKAPDFILYRHAKALYEAYLELQKEHLAEALAGKARSRAELIVRIGELEMFGELLSRFPLLLEYLELENRLQ